MFKKVIHIILILLLVCSLLSACQSPADSPSLGEEPSLDIAPSSSPTAMATTTPADPPTPDPLPNPSPTAVPADPPTPDTIPSLSPTVPAAAATPAAQSWQDAYTAFLRENIPAGEIDFDALAQGSDEQERYGAFLAGGYPAYPFFYLYDMDKDGTPELICMRPAADYNGDVYTFTGNAISKLGNIKFYPFGGIGIHLDRGNGLYSDTGYKGQYGEVYDYTIENGSLKSQLVLEYNNEPEKSDHPGNPYDLNNFKPLDYYEVTEANIAKVILG